MVGLVTSLINRSSPSISLAPNKTSIVTEESSLTVEEIIVVTGASLTDVISIFRVAVTSPPLPSETVYSKESCPK